MSRRALDQQHHVLRWVSHDKLEHDPDTGEIVGVLPTAFQVRPVDRGKLSTHWIEHFLGTQQEQIRGAARDLGKRVYTNKTKGGAFAFGNVGRIKEEGRRQSGVEIDAVLSGSPHNPAHTEVGGIALEDLALQMLLATSSWSQFVTARDVLDF